jgi:hypothetical protein
MRSTLAVTTALLLLLGIGVAEAADPTMLAQTAGFLMGNAHGCGVQDERVERAGKVINYMIGAARPHWVRRRPRVRALTRFSWRARSQTKTGTR